MPEHRQILLTVQAERCTESRAADLVEYIAAWNAVTETNSVGERVKGAGRWIVYDNGVRKASNDTDSGTDTCKGSQVASNRRGFAWRREGRARRSPERPETCTRVCGRKYIS